MRLLDSLAALLFPPHCAFCGKVGVRGFDQLITARTGIHATVAENAIQCVAEGTGKSLESIQDMQDGTMNLSRRKQIN